MRYIRILLRAGYQTAEALPTRERGTPLVMGQRRRISLAVEVEWIEREYQYFICWESQSYDPTIGFKTDASHLGTYPSELEDQLYWWLAYYHFVRPHESLRVRLPEPILRKGKQRPRLYEKMTPAMAAGITSRRWSVMVPVSAREGTDQFSAAIMRVRLPEPIQRKGKQRPRLYEKMTPAMAAGITSRRWSVKELISFPLP